jgi:UDP-N-acetylmuramoyl-L-alanyl-D-glutamate--2,6-diaminopimelate ligase
MGEIASEYDSVILLTAEDPRSELVTQIADEIASGIIKVGDVPELHIIPDRKTAIAYAVSLAMKNDIVVITGKGHETSMNISGNEIPWSDHEAVKKALQERYEK